MRKRRKHLIHTNKRLILVNAFLVLSLFLGLGYSLLSTNLDILGDVQLKEYLEPTLYNVLKKEDLEYVKKDKDEKYVFKIKNEETYYYVDLKTNTFMYSEY